MQDDLTERGQWEKNPASIGEIFYVKRIGWQNAGGFSDNITRAGHPALVTNDCPIGVPVMKVVPGSTVKKLNKRLFSPIYRVKYFKDHFVKNVSYYVLNYWRTVSRRRSVTPFKIGEIHVKDKARLRSAMIKEQSLC